MKNRTILCVGLFAMLVLIPSVHAEVFNCVNCSDCNATIQTANPGDVVMLTADITDCADDCIEFDGADGITFDCGGHVIAGTGNLGETGIYLSANSNDNTIKNCTICEFYTGIEIAHSQNNTVTDVVSKDNNNGGVYLYHADYNNLTNVSASGNKYFGNPYGFKLRYSNHNNLTNVTAEDTKGSSAFGGFYVEYSNNNNFTDLIASDNNKYGIYIRWNSNHNRIRNATITTNEGQGGLYIYSISGQSIHNDIDNSNTINGKPIQFFDGYYKACPDDQVLDYNDMYSLIHFYGGNNITLYATTLEDSLFLWSTDNSEIYDVNASHGWDGIVIWYSDSNTFTNITTSYNSNDGFYARYAYDNNFIDLLSYYNKGNGFELRNLYNNVFTNVTACNNDKDGVYLQHSDYNIFTNATVSGNNGDGLTFGYSTNYNTVTNSQIEQNYGAGLDIDSSTSGTNQIYNNILNNTVNLVLVDGISNPNYLNTTLNCSSVPNIVGGQCIGGNFWAEPDGTGWSQTCVDIVEPFGICDEEYDLSNGLSEAIDWLPLTGNDTTFEFIPCASCADCTQKIASASPGEVVQLVVDINSPTGNCIEFNSADGITFDCHGYTISGGVDAGYGFYLNAADDNIIRNCPGIDQFQRGLYLNNAENNTVTDITVEANQEGIRLSGSSQGNTIVESRIENNNGYGIYLEASGANYPRYNSIYDNYLNNSINLYSNNANNENYWNTTLDCTATSTNIIDRRCIGGNYWTDPNNGGHSNTCTDSDQNGICDSPYTAQTDNIDFLPLTGELTIKDCFNCSDCSEKLASVAADGTVRLITDITNQDCDCILISRGNVTFDGQNHFIDGDGDWDGSGIHLDASSYGDLHNVMVRNCSIRQFDSGIYFDGSTVNTIEDSSVAGVTVSNNKLHGIDLAYSHYNTVTDVESRSNGNDGIMIQYSAHNTLDDFEAESNGQCGIYILFAESSHNNLTNVTSSSNSYAGIYLDRCSYTGINDSQITGNSVGLNIGNSGSNQIYNNYFCNDENVWIRGTEYVNDWNITNSSGPNIVGKPYLGGNYWSDYKGMDNSDGFGDTPYNVNGTGELNIDYLPLFDPPDIRIDPTTLNFKIVSAYGGQEGKLGIPMRPPRSQPTEPVDRILVDGRPPEIIRAPAVSLPKPHIAAGINVLQNVPVFDWSYGCSATAAAMMMGYYDNNGYPNMYTGPANDGVCPLTNSVWGSGECPLSATHQGFDGLSVRGHVDDYWISYGSGSPDPYVTDSSAQQTWGNCTADFMGTNQDKFGSTDGATWFWFYKSGAALYDYYPGMGEHDGCYGMRRFVESRGYIVLENFNQYIYGYNSNTDGFTFDDYMAEIDAGRPVIIQVTEHSMLGFGYDNETGNQAIYIHDTWDHASHNLTWGGNYDGLTHYGVTVMRLAPVDCTQQARVFSIIEDAGKSLAIDSISKNESWITLDYPAASFNMVGYGQRAVIARVDGTQANGGDSDVISISSNDPDESPVGVTVNVLGLCGDIDGNGIVNIMDVRLLMNHVEDPHGYPVEPWTGDVDGDGDIDGDDVQRLLGHVFAPEAHPLTCC